MQGEKKKKKDFLCEWQLNNICVIYFCELQKTAIFYKLSCFKF